MRLLFSVAIAASIGIAALAVSCNENESSAVAEPAAATDSSSLIARGEYLVNVIGCDDCHSPKQMGPRGPELIADLRFSGYPASRPSAVPDGNSIANGWVLMGGDLTSAAGPWGISYAANISSDSTGIGNWTEEQFFRCMREGKQKGLEDGRPLLPPMPWNNFAKMSDEDLRAVFLYLKSTPPVKNAVPAALPPSTAAVH